MFAILCEMSICTCTYSWVLKCWQSYTQYCSLFIIFVINCVVHNLSLVVNQCIMSNSIGLIFTSYICYKSHFKHKYPNIYQKAHSYSWHTTRFCFCILHRMLLGTQMRLKAKKSFETEKSSCLFSMLFMKAKTPSS